MRGSRRDRAEPPAELPVAAVSGVPGLFRAGAVRTALFAAVCALNAFGFLLGPLPVPQLAGAATMVTLMALLPIAVAVAVPERWRHAVCWAVVVSSAAHGVTGLYLALFATMSTLYEASWTTAAAGTLLLAGVAGLAALWCVRDLRGEHSALRRLASLAFCDPAPAQVSDESAESARAAERSRLRRELHDGLGPSLTAIQLRLETAASAISRDHAAREIMAGAVAATSHTIREMHRVLEDLRPADLDGEDLAQALRRLAARLGDGLVRIRAEVPDRAGKLPAPTELAIYRIASEGLANACRHAQAREITMRLELRPNVVTLDILDDGINGMGGSRGPTADSRHRELRGIGLASMAERAAEIGGRCVVLPRPDARCGTLVRAVLPRQAA